MKKIFKELFELFVKSNKREPNAIEMLQLKFKASQKASQQVGKGEVIPFPPERITDWTKARPQPPEIEIIDGVQTTRGLGDLFERQMKNIGKKDPALYEDRGGNIIPAQFDESPAFPSYTAKETEDQIIAKLKNKPLDPDDAVPNYTETPGEYSRRNTPGSIENLREEMKIAYRNEFDRLTGNETAEELKEILKNLDTDGVPFAAGGVAGLLAQGMDVVRKQKKEIPEEIKKKIFEMMMGTRNLGKVIENSERTKSRIGPEGVKAYGLAEGGRTGYNEGLTAKQLKRQETENLAAKVKEYIDIKGSGSISGKQDMYSTGEKSAIKLPEGTTSNVDFINLIANLDIPISEKISLLGGVQYDKFRNKIEKGDKELFLEDPASSINRKIGIGFDSGTGTTGSAKYGIDDKGFMFEIKKTFAEGGPTSTGLNYLLGEDDTNSRVSYGAGGRRGFLKLLAGLGAAGAAFKTGLMSLTKGGVKPIVKELISVPIGNPQGMPVWFKPLVNKIIKEGDDVTKKFGTVDRELVHTKKLDKFEEVTVYQDLSTGNVRLEYGPHLTDDTGKVIRASNEPNVVHLEYKAPEVIEPNPKTGKGGGKTKDEFYAAESEPEIVNWDGDIEMSGENVVNTVDDLISDTSKLQKYATDNKLTIKELSDSMKKQKYKNKLDSDPMEQVNYIENKQGMDAMDYIDEGARVGDFDPKGYRNYDTKGMNLYDGIKKIEKAEGGRMGYAGGGMGKRAFLKLMGGVGAGIAGLKTGLLGLTKGGGKKVATEAVKKAATGGPPPHFFKLVAKIKALGDDVTETAALADRQKVTKYKDFELTEDLTTGRQEIQRYKVLDDGQGQADYYGQPLTEETYMGYSPGEEIFQETAKGKTKITKTQPDYEEGTAYIRSDREYAGDVVDEMSGIADDIYEEVGEAIPEAIRKGKADGGRMGYAGGKKVVQGLISLLNKKAGKNVLTTADKLPIPKKTIDRDMFRQANNRLNKKRQLTDQEIQDYEMELGDSETWMSEGTVGEAENALKNQKAYQAEMYQQYKMGKLDPVAGDKSPARKRFLEQKFDEMEGSGDPKLMTRDEIEELTFFDMGTEMDNFGLSSAEKKGKKLADSMSDAEIDLRDEFPGIEDRLIKQILTDDNPQRVAEVKQTMREALEMQNKGMSVDEIIQTFKGTTRTKQAEGGRMDLWLGGGLKAGKSLTREMLKFMSKGSTNAKSPKELLKLYNPKQFNRLLDNPLNTGKISPATGETADEMILDMINKTKEDRADMVGDLIGSARKIKKVDDDIIAYKNKIIKDMIEGGIDKETANSFANKIATDMKEEAAPQLTSYIPKITDQGLIELENIQKNLLTKDKRTA
jgi:hypothetical protein